MKSFLTKQHLPMIVVVSLIVWAWLSLFSVLIAGLF
mgnify:CR=1 FL=1